MHDTKHSQGHPGHGIVEMSPDKVKAAIEDLKKQNKTIVLATKTLTHQAEISYVPYVAYQNKYYIILSKSSSHYENIMEAKAFQGMILEDEAKAVSTFFRKRIILNLMYQGINEKEDIVEQFVATHGTLTNQLLKMNFNIFELKVIDGRVILGPAQAYRFDECENITEQIIKGH